MSRSNYDIHFTGSPQVAKSFEALIKSLLVWFLPTSTIGNVSSRLSVSILSIYHCNRRDKGCYVYATTLATTLVIAVQFLQADVMPKLTDDLAGPLKMMQVGI